MALLCLNILGKQLNHMGTSIPRQIAKKLVFGVSFLFCLITVGQKHSCNKRCMAGVHYGNTLHKCHQLWQIHTTEQSSGLTMIRMFGKFDSQVVILYNAYELS